MKVVIAVTHLLGSGHLARALELAKAFRVAGHEVRLVSGGFPVRHLDFAGVELVQLPPLKSDGTDFRELLDENGDIAGEPYLRERIAMIEGCLVTFRPDIVITELFPFGRRALRGEFNALIDLARGLHRPPVVLSSVRDILAPPSKPDRIAQTTGLISNFYDAVLVHADPEIVTLDQSWPVTPEIAEKLAYTGYVAPPRTSSPATRDGIGEILVSTGGGAVGTAVFQTAMQAAAIMPERKWRLLVGGMDGAERITRLRDRYPGSPAVLEPARPDFRQMLGKAHASVSLCGYNTALDVLGSNVPAVFVPFDEGGETEQRIRAKSLAQQNGIVHLPADDLTPRALCHQIERVVADPPRKPHSFRFDGAVNSVKIAVALAEARQ